MAYRRVQAVIRMLDQDGNEVAPLPLPDPSPAPPRVAPAVEPPWWLRMTQRKRAMLAHLSAKVFWRSNLEQIAAAEKQAKAQVAAARDDKRRRRR